MRQFIKPLQAALACVARAKLVVRDGAKRDVGKEHFWALNGEDGYVHLGGEGRLQLLARMRFMIIEDSRKDFGPYRITRTRSTRTCTSGLRRSQRTR